MESDDIGYGFETPTNNGKPKRYGTVTPLRRYTDKPRKLTPTGKFWVGYLALYIACLFGFAWAVGLV